MLVVLSWLAVLLQACSDLGGSEQLVDRCQVQHPPAPSVPVALQGATLPAHVASLASALSQLFKILFLPQTPWLSPNKAEGAFPCSV